MRTLVYAALTVSLASLSAAAFSHAGEKVQLVRQGDQIVVKVDGEDFTVYNTSKEKAKPFFFPVHAPGGTVISRPLLRPGDDHPHHKGIWVSVDEVNKAKFWAERARIENQSVTILAEKANPARMRIVNHWLKPAGGVMLTETTDVDIYADRLMAYDITFTAGDEQVTFEDTKEGLLGFRMVNSMREKEGGRVINSKGEEGSKVSWGNTYEWIDYYGPVEGKTFGVALFDHPLNFRPSRYHVRDYGLFSISPFGEHSYTNGNRPEDPVVLAPGKSLRLRYGIYFHAGDTAAGDVAGVYHKYIARPE